MKIALISDIHANLEALRALQHSLSAEAVDKVIFLGDIVGYGANPNECIELLAQIADCMIAGNHDWAALGKSSADYFNPAARGALEWTRAQLSRDSLKFLASLELQGEMEDFMYVHATPRNPHFWDYVIGTGDAQASFETFPHRLCFIAHSHQPVVFMMSETGVVTADTSSRITLHRGHRYIINIGSVGQPRDGNPLSSYGIYAAGIEEYRLVRFQYDVTGAQQKIVDAGLDPFLATRLAFGM